MKDLYLSLLLLLSTASANFGQIPVYFKENTSWSTELVEVTGEAMMPVIQTSKKLFYINSTTTIGEYEYYTIKERKHVRTDMATGPDDYIATDSEVIHVRQEGRAIYARIAGIDSLFISYDLDIGDTIGGYFGAKNPGYTVHEIDSVILGDGSFRLAIFLDSTNSISLFEGIAWSNATYGYSQYFAYTDFTCNFYGYGLINFNFYCYAESFEKLYPNHDWGICFPTLGISVEAAENNIIVSPNPVSNQITLQNINQNYTQATITDLSGKILINLSTTDLNTSIDISTLNSGVFILQLQKENGEIQRLKFVKS